MVLRRSLLLVVLLATFAMRPAFGQAKDSPVAFVSQDAITTSFVASPQQGGTASGGTPNANNNWLKVEWHYGTTGALLTRYLDSVEFKIYIEGFDPDVVNANAPGGHGVAIALTANVTYVNVTPGKDIYGVVYVHPSTLARYSNDRGYENYDRKYNVHIEANVGGKLMDSIDKHKETDLTWFRNLQPVANLVYRMDQSPFIMADVDRYPALKMQSPAGQ